MQANWIITSNPEAIRDKVAAATGLPTWKAGAWDELAVDSAGQQNLFLSDFPAAEQQEQAAAFAGRLRDYVQNGGCLTVLGESASLLALVFPEKVTGFRRIEPGKAQLKAVEPALAYLTGEYFPIELTAPLVVPAVLPDSLQVFIQQDVPDPEPVVFAFEFGSGSVICQPLPPGSIEGEDTLLAFLPATAQAQSVRPAMLEKAKKEHAAIAAEYPLLLSAEKPVVSIGFSTPQGKSALVLLYWQGNARVQLHIEDERGRVALNHTRESPPFAWYAPMPGAAWHCKAELLESRDPVLPVLLACCTIDPPARKKYPQGNPAGAGKVRRCPKCKMPLNPTMKFCPACGRKVDLPTPR